MYKKKCPKYKIVSKLDICKITDTNSNHWLIQDIRCASLSICFHMFNFVSGGGGGGGGGELKMLNFQVACAQKFQNKNDSFLRCQQIWNVVINL